MAPPPLALSGRRWHVALETPATMARSAWRQSNWRLTCLAGRAALTGRAAAFQWEQQQGSAMGLATLAEYGKRQQLWRFRVFKYTISFIIFFSCFPLQFCFRFRDFGNFCHIKYFFVSYFVRWLWKFLWYQIFFVSYFVRLE